MTATLPMPVTVKPAPDPARMCGECVPDGYGPPCNEHYLDADHEFTRGLDR